MKSVSTGKSFYYRALGRANQILNRIETRLERQKVLSRPVNVDVVLTKACNFACVFCKDYETPYGSTRVSLDNFEKLARRLFPYAMRLSICSGGEPYLHPQLEDIMRIGRRYGLDTWVLSNGSIIKKMRLRTMVQEELITEHGFSVDGFKPETVESIRVNADLNTILRNIEMLQRIKKEEEKDHPRVIIRYALMRTNIEELPNAVNRWGEMGVDELHCGYLSLANNMDRNLSLFYHQELMEEYLLKAREAAAQYPHLQVMLPPLVREEQQRTAPSSCSMPWSFVMIDSNGEIMPCYRTFEALRLSNLYEGGDKFSNVWNSKAYQEIRRTVNDDSTEKYFPYCNKCENRVGWGTEGPHLGDDFWLEQLGTNWVPVDLDHSRLKKGGLHSKKKTA